MTSFADLFAQITSNLDPNLADLLISMERKATKPHSLWVVSAVLTFKDSQLDHFSTSSKDFGTLNDHELMVGLFQVLNDIRAHIAAQSKNDGLTMKTIKQLQKIASSLSDIGLNS